MSNQKMELQTVVERLERVEMENRWFKRLLAVLFLIPIALLAMGQARPSKTVEAEQFILRDVHGKARVTIGTPASSGAAIFLEPNEPAIWITDGNGTDRAILTSDALRFADSKGRPAGSYTSQGKR